MKKENNVLLKLIMVTIFIIVIISGILLMKKYIRQETTTITSINDIDNKLSYIVQGISYKIIDDNNKYVSVETYSGDDINMSIPDTVVIENQKYTVTQIGEGAFRNSSNLTSIVIPDSVTNIGTCAFAECGKLNTVVIGNGVTTIESRAFENTTEVKELTMPITLSMESGGMNELTKLTKVTLTKGKDGQGINYYVDEKDSAEEKKDREYLQRTPIWASKENITTVVIDQGVKRIGRFTFNGCHKLTNLTIGKDVTSIGDGAFNACSALQKLEIPNSVETIEEGAFLLNSALTNVTIGTGVKAIEAGAFRSCSSLTSIVIPDSVTSIGEYAFAECTKLKNAIISNNVKKIKDATFAECSSLESVTISTETQISASAIDQNSSVVIKYRDNNNIVYKINDDKETATVVENSDNKDIPETVKINGKEYYITNNGPVIKVSIPDTNTWTKENIIVDITVTDIVEITSVKVNDKTVNLVDGKVKFSIGENNTYKIEATNINNQSKTKSFTINNIDKIEPIIEKISNNSIYAGTVKPNIKDNESGISTIKLIKDGKEISYTNGDAIKEKGKYELEVIDNVGNKTTMNFEITDKFENISWLKIDGISKDYTKDKQTIKITISNNIVKKVAIDETELENKSNTYSYIADKKGSYILKIYDNDDNIIYYNTLEVLIDNNVPIIVGIKDKETYDSAVAIRANDNESGINKIVIIKDGEEIKDYVEGKELKEDGEYVVTVYDNVGNMTSVTFYIKNTHDNNENSSTDDSNNGKTDGMTSNDSTSGSKTDKNQDTSIATSIIPKAGYRSLFIAILCLTLVITIALCIKNEKYKDIK